MTNGSVNSQPRSKTTRAQGDEEETRIALQRKQTHEADTWREMCTVPASTEADELLAAAMRGGDGGGGLGLNFLGHHKDGRGNDAGDEDEAGEEDTDLPPGTRCRLSPMTGEGVVV